LFGAIVAVETLGDFVGPVLGGVIFDATGSYSPAFAIYIGGFIIAALAFAASRPSHSAIPPRSS
jgi:hypothetical protein